MARGSVDMHAVILDALTPIVGRPIAEICVRSCAIAAGKPTEDLAVQDVPQIARVIRESLGSITSQTLLDRAVDRIGESAR